MAYRLYSDGTQMVFNGDLSYHPVFLTLANIDSATRRLPWCHRLVGFIPRLTGTKAERKTEWFKFAKVTLFQKCVDRVLNSTLKPSEEYTSTTLILILFTPLSHFVCLLLLIEVATSPILLESSSQCIHFLPTRLQTGKSVSHPFFVCQKEDTSLK